MIISSWRKEGKKKKASIHGAYKLGPEEYAGFQQSEVRRVDIPGGEMPQARGWEKESTSEARAQSLYTWERER